MIRRNRQFHSLFRSIPNEEQLIKTYHCAIQKDILIQGHIYISEHHICFKSNIFGWTTTIVLPFTDISSIKKRKTVKMIPNAIEIYQKSNQKQHFLTSFMSRDRTYQLMTDLWWKHHQNKSIQSIPEQQQQISDTNQQNKTEFYTNTDVDDITGITIVDNNESQLMGIQRQPDIQTPQDKKKQYQQSWNQDYQWVMATLSIILLLSGISIAYRINIICHQLMQW
ncbi:GRAM domain-containing protein [Circinella umbellata]|nr:GRAM domain-containing protein [Circinella umbellata]